MIEPLPAQNVKNAQELANATVLIQAKINELVDKVNTLWEFADGHQHPESAIIKEPDKDMPRTWHEVDMIIEYVVEAERDRIVEGLRSMAASNTPFLYEEAIKIVRGSEL